MRMRKKMKIILTVGMILSLLTVFHIQNNTYAQDNQGDPQDQNEPMQNRYFTVIDAEGNVELIEYEDEVVPATLDSNDYEVMTTSEDTMTDVETFDTYEEAQEAIASQPQMFSPKSRIYEIQTVADTKDIAYGVARIIGYTQYTEYDGTEKGRVGYTHGTSANDAAYIATINDGKMVRVKQAGVFMDIPVDNVEVTEYSSSSKVSYYFSENGVLRHYYYAGTYGKESKLYSTQVGYTPEYLKDNVKYYSYDGHYFYTSYVRMLQDYQNGVDYYQHAVNSSKPYYNYYQYLSFRSETKFSADDFNGLVQEAIKNYSSVDDTSKLKNQGQSLLNNQKKNGINASLMLGVSINESAWGMSYYSQDRNNLFGLGAVDSNPNKAYRFDTVEDCFNYFSYNTISAGYLDADDWRYRGPHLGDKQSGINVKYASDPYWGEKAASFSYLLNDDAKQKDYQQYSLAIAKKGEIVFYKEDTGNFEVFYSSATDTTNHDVYNFPITITETATNRYKVLSDTVLNQSRNDINASGYFDAKRDYVYVNKNDVTIINTITNNSEPNEEEPVIYLKGDVNGDGKVTSLDYIQIKNHIMKTKLLSGDALKRADVNEDGKVTSLDYIKIKNHIMGTNLLF